MTAEAGSVPGARAAGDGHDAHHAGRPKRRWEAADAIIAASMALVAIIVGVFVLLCVQGYDVTIESAKKRAETAAGVVAEQTRWVFASVRSTLDHLATAADADPAALTAQLASFESATSQIPMQMRVGLYDATGTLVAAGPNAPPTRASLAGADFFDAVADGQTWSLSAQERNPATGDAIFAVARRLEVDGRFTGAAVAVMDAGVLRRLAESQDLGAGSTISIIRSDGWVIARNPSLSVPLDLSGSENFTAMQEGDSGSYGSGTSPADGVARIVGYRHVHDLGYIAIAAIAQETALAGLWRGIWIVSLLIAPIAMALLVGSFVTAGILRRSEATRRSLATALEHNETLFREIHHRVKNNLQSINSLLQLHPIPREVRADISRRIAAMSAVHEHIYRSNDFAQVRVKEYLHTLIANVRAGYDPNVELVEDIEDVAVDKDTAGALGLIVNEVVSNCFKHAFSDGRAGKVEVALRELGDGRAALTVRDNGLGFDPDSPASGIGRRLVQGFTAQLQGETSHVSENGSVFTLTFPLATP